MPDKTTNGWRQYRFGEIASIDGGLVSPIDAQYAKLPHVGPENIESSSGRIENVRSAQAEGLRSGKYLFDADAIVYSKIRPNLNKVCTPGFRGLCSADCYVVRPKDRIVVRDYLALLMRSADFVRQAVEVSARTGMPKINRPDLLRLWVSVPDERIQLRVAELARGFSTVGKVLADLCDAKRSFKRGLMQQLLTGKRRFPEFVRSMGRLHTPFGSMPRDWDYARLGDVAAQISQRAGVGNNVTVLACSKYDGLVPSLTYFGRRIYATDTSNYKIVMRGDFAFPSNHIEEGSIGLLRDFERGLVSPIYTVFRPTDSIVPEFLFALFKTETYRHVFATTTNASVDRRGSLRWKEFSKLRVPVPTIDEQRRIAELLGDADAEIRTLSRYSDLFERQKRALLNKLLSGELRLPER